MVTNDVTMGTVVLVTASFSLTFSKIFFLKKLYLVVMVTNKISIVNIVFLTEYYFKKYFGCHSYY